MSQSEPAGIFLGPQARRGEGNTFDVHSPVNGEFLAQIAGASADQLREAIAMCAKSFYEWRCIPAPKRGEFVRRISVLVRERKEDLARIVTLECGKIIQEALGEVQEWIDICDFAVGLSRQLHGLSIVSERPMHRMMEQWHPLGPIGVITAFNFPVAVWAWNAMLAFVCGDTVVWKPSEKTPLTSIACNEIVCSALKDFDDFPQYISALVIGGSEIGVELAADGRLPMISATGSVRMGREVSRIVANRLGRSLLELGGNNGMIVSAHANIDLAIRAIVFAATGTAGQRCTSLRRLIVHESIEEEIVYRLRRAYSTLRIGDPRIEGTLVGPLINEQAWDAMKSALHQARLSGAEIFGGERITEGLPPGVYVTPAIVRIRPDAKIVRTETFAPVLYVMRYHDLSEAIAIHNAVPQ